MSKRKRAQSPPLPPVVVGPCPSTEGADVAEVVNQQRDAELQAMVDRFLAWPLPDSVCSDTCVTMRPYAFPRSGTNLLTADEARQMLEYVVLRRVPSAPTSAQEPRP